MLCMHLAVSLNDTPWIQGGAISDMRTLIVQQKKAERRMVHRVVGRERDGVRL